MGLLTLSISFLMFNIFISYPTFILCCSSFKRMLDTDLFLSWAFRLLIRIFCRLLAKMFKVVRSINIIMVYIPAKEWSSRFNNYKLNVDKNQSAVRCSSDTMLHRSLIRSVLPLYLFEWHSLQTPESWSWAILLKCHMM